VADDDTTLIGRVDALLSDALRCPRCDRWMDVICQIDADKDYTGELETRILAFAQEVRREALELAMRAACDRCDAGDPLTAEDWHDGGECEAGWCSAVNIRTLIGEEKGRRLGITPEELADREMGRKP
jgi:hypothetical protein